eukprot:XP_001707668.1 Hypothetical protein GL50803_99461 [Giardia lamblia ATCC 50803]
MWHSWRDRGCMLLNQLRYFCIPPSILCKWALHSRSSCKPYSRRRPDPSDLSPFQRRRTKGIWTCPLL